MKIGITCYPTYGGSGVVATELGLELARRNHEVHFISYSQPIRLTAPEPNIHYHEVEVSNYPLFQHPPYSLALASRMAEVAEIDGVRFINDSKATNVDATIKSLEAFPGNILLIAGGRDKGGDFRPLRPLVAARVKRLIVIGEAAGVPVTTPAIVAPSATRAAACSRTNVAGPARSPGRPEAAHRRFPRPSGRKAQSRQRVRRLRRRRLTRCQRRSKIRQFRRLKIRQIDEGTSLRSSWPPDALGGAVQRAPDLAGRAGFATAPCVAAGGSCCREW